MTKIDINNNLILVLEKRAIEKNKSTEEYINELLEQIVSKLKQDKSKSKEDEDVVKQRLKHLGYL